MSENKTVLGLVGSPNSKGLTNRLVTAALESAARAGAATELIQVSDHIVNACRDCLPWVCQTNLKCTYQDDSFEMLNQKILDCGGLVIGTPVYWGDTSAMVRFLFLKMFRVFAMSGKLSGLPAFGIAIAGGSGNGLISGLRPLYHFFQVMQMRPLEPIPATRFNLNQATKKAEAMGSQITGMIQERAPFNNQEESLLWYDRLPYLGEDRVGEKKLLATITSEAIPDERKLDINGNLGQVEILAASGRPLDAITEISNMINSCSKILSEQ